MNDKKKVKSIYSMKDTINEGSIMFSEAETFKNRKSILKNIMGNYEKKYSINSRRQSGKSRKSVNFRDAENISYDQSEYAHRNLTRSDFNKTPSKKSIIEIDLNKNKKDKSFNNLILQITHNTQNNISIISSNNMSPRSIIDKANVDFPQFSILRKGHSSNKVVKKVEFEKDFGEKEIIKRTKTAFGKNNDIDDLNDPNYIEPETPRGERWVRQPSPKRYFKTTAFKSHDVKENLVNITEEHEETIRQKLKDKIDDPKYPKIVCERVGSIAGVSCSSFENQR
jgi:hypothetical protein